MRNNKIEVYIHFVWATYDRLPTLTANIARGVYRNIEHEAQKLNCDVLAINGISDHVHALLKMSTTVSMAECVKMMKGVSSKYGNEAILHEELYQQSAEAS